MSFGEKCSSIPSTVSFEIAPFTPVKTIILFSPSGVTLIIACPIFDKGYYKIRVNVALKHQIPYKITYLTKTTGIIDFSPNLFKRNSLIMPLATWEDVKFVYIKRFARQNKMIYRVHIVNITRAEIKYSHCIQLSRQTRHSVQVIIVKGLPVTTHRTVSAVFPHTALQTDFGFQFQISLVKCGSAT